MLDRRCSSFTTNTNTSTASTVKCTVLVLFAVPSRSRYLRDPARRSRDREAVEVAGRTRAFSLGALVHGGQAGPLFERGFCHID